jgi:glycine cleavage system aminomethyltransferase T
MCLYGNDLDQSTTPVEAGLSWVIGKDRRAAGGFIGSETVLDQLKNGPPRRRVGLIVEEAPARRAFLFVIYPLLFKNQLILDVYRGCEDPGT